MSRPLTFERLESRRLAASAEFNVNLYENVGGVLGDLIADDTVEVGDQFFVEITARDWDPATGGIRGVAFDSPMGCERDQRNCHRS
jgi:hypothetical protein